MRAFSVKNFSLINAINVSFRYGDTMILKDVNFDIKKSEFISLIGPNGGGKTTLLKLLLGFLKPCKGTVYVFGKSPEEAYRRISYVPQSLQCDKQFPISVLEVVLGGRLSRSSLFGYKKEDQKRALQLLKQINLLHLVNRPFATLSGGETQKALIARALISDPEILILDEPTANIDLEAKSEIYEILQSLRGKVSILMVTHDLKAIKGSTDRVFYVQKNVLPLKIDEVCEHLNMGLYHPLLEKNKAKKQM